MRARWIAAAATLFLAGCMTPSEGDSAAQESLTFVCDRSDGFSVIFADESAVLTTAQGDTRMASQPVASGFSYAGGGQSIRGKGPELTWTKADGSQRPCREQNWAMQQPQIQPPMPAIGGTKWTLIGFQSSDDAMGTVVPPRPERYTLSFEPDGRLTAQLDCNRATGTWQVTSQSSTGGSLAISGGAMTRAMGGPGAMDSRIAADFSRVRSYTLRSGRLYLALEADAGIYEFRASAD